jgi:AMP-binding enzyme/AMP-binding enzyme C-terminal domain
VWSIRKTSLSRRERSARSSCAGDVVMMGYWERPEETKKAIVDGWMHTGDAGYMDEDAYVYIVDRVKDMIVTGGENVYSAEVENCVAQHPAVAQCAVIGIPDEKWGEAVHAVVMRKPGAAVTEADIIEFCKARIAGLQMSLQRENPGRDTAAFRRRQDSQARIAQALLGRQDPAGELSQKGRPLLPALAPHCEPDRFLRGAEQRARLVGAFLLLGGGGGIIDNAGARLDVH